MEENKSLQKTPQTNQQLELLSKSTSPIVQLLRARQPALTSEIAQCLTIAKAVDHDSFSKMRARVGGALTEMHVILLLKEAVRFFNNSLSDTDLAFYAKRITLNYHYWRMEDLTICINNGIGGKYGHSMARFTYGDTFVGWATSYDMERDEYFTNLRIEQNKQLAVDNSEVKNLVPVEKFTELAQKFEVPKVREVKTHNVQTRERNKTDEYIDQFEALNKSQNGVKSSMGYVTYLNRKVDINEYLTIKMDETI